MQLFYIPDCQAGVMPLPADEARHAVQVLRKRPGDVLDVVDGRGGWFQASLLEVGKREVVASFTETRREAQRAAYSLTMAVAPTKNADRLEWFLEKATELGVDHIVPLQCTRGERERLRADRLEKVLVAAMKQSLQAWLPQLADLTPFNEVVTTARQPQRYIAWIDEEVNTLLHRTYPPGSDVIILIGPEGDFTPEEVALARQHQFQPVSLGPNRLRTETAAVIAVHAVAQANW